MRMKPSPPRPEMDELWEAVKKRPPMTKEQFFLQQRSWVIGEMMLGHPEMTREEAERIYDSL